MDTDFWHDRWHRGDTGWHLPHVNPLLARHWPRLAIQPDARVLVPLCGKSEDMAWLAGQGYRVIGVELSPAAAQAFFDEHGWTVDITRIGAFHRYCSGPVEILCGDYFALDTATLGPVGAAYDRGALVALPPAMRERYVAQLRTLLPVPVPTLLIAFDYAQQEMDGPPFAVGPGDVARYFGATHAIELLSSVDALTENPRFRERGLGAMTENTFALTPLSAE